MERKIDRLDRYAEYKNLNDNQITRDCHLAVGTLGKSRKPDKDLSRRSCESILNTYGDISRLWFLNGEGEMLQETSAEQLPTYPYIDMATAECGMPFGDMRAFMAADCPRIALPGLPPNTEFFVKASGYSMVNSKRPELSIPPGSYVGLTKLQNNFLRWGEVYALATSDGIMIKKIMPVEDDHNMIRCISYNESEYPEFLVHRNDIYDFARLTCVIPVIIR